MPTEEQLLEIHRLAVLGGEADIAHWTTNWLARAWLGYSRFRDVEALCRKTLDLGPNASTFYHLGWAKNVLGEREEALRLSFAAHRLYEETNDRLGQATTLTNIGMVYRSTGQPEQALEYYRKALPITEEVGDRVGQAVTRYNIAIIYVEQGRIEEGVVELRQVVWLDQLTGNPDLEADRAMLTQLEQALDA